MQKDQAVQTLKALRDAEIYSGEELHKVIGSVFDIVMEQKPAALYDVLMEYLYQDNIGVNVENFDHLIAKVEAE